MKKLKTFTGGHPISTNDLNHIQDGVSEALIELVKGLATNGVAVPNCKLYGCVETIYGDDSATITAGAIILDGEICIFDALSIPDVLIGGVPRYTASDSYPSDNPVLYANGIPQNIHLNRKATIVFSSSAVATNQMSWGASYLKDLIKQNIGEVIDPWHYVGTSGAPAYMNGFNNGYQTTPLEGLRYRKGKVECRISGAIDYEKLGSLSAINIELTIFNLPVGFRPDLVCSTQFRVSTPAGSATIKINVYPTGDVKALCTQMDSGMVVSDLMGGSPYGEWFELLFSLA